MFDMVVAFVVGMLVSPIVMPMLVKMKDMFFGMFK